MGLNELMKIEQCNSTNLPEFNDQADWIFYKTFYAVNVPRN